MSTTTYGRSGLKLQPGSEVTETKEGLSTGTATWQAPAKRAYELAPLIGSSHPYVKFLRMERRRIIFNNDFAIISGEFAGMDPSKGEDSIPVYELQIGTSEEPAEVHPDFVSKIAGRPSRPLNGAYFIDPGTGDQTTDDKIGVFEKFVLIHNGEKNRLAGIVAYLDASEVIWRKKYTSRARPNDIASVGTIDSPEGPNPNLGKGRTWLYNGLSYTERGDVFSIAKEWRCSARGGWNELFYD